MDDDVFFRQFGLRIRELRRQKGLTQEDLAAATDMSVQGLSKVERGMSAPQLDTVRRIALALGTPIYELLRLYEDDADLTATLDEVTTLLKAQSPAMRALAVEMTRLLLKGRKL